MTEKQRIAEINDWLGEAMLWSQEGNAAKAQRDIDQARALAQTDQEIAACDRAAKIVRMQSHDHRESF